MNLRLLIPILFASVASCTATPSALEQFSRYHQHLVSSAPRELQHRLLLFNSLLAASLSRIPAHKRSLELLKLSTLCAHHPNACHTAECYERWFGTITNLNYRHQGPRNSRWFSSTTDTTAQSMAQRELVLNTTLRSIPLIIGVGALLLFIEWWRNHEARSALKKVQKRSDGAEAQRALETARTSKQIITTTIAQQQSKASS